MIVKLAVPALVIVVSPIALVALYMWKHSWKAVWCSHKEPLNQGALVYPTAAGGTPGYPVGMSGPGQGYVAAGYPIVAGQGMAGTPGYPIGMGPK